MRATGLHGLADLLGDQHLLADAPAYALRRLRKAELIRLWRVAGMWKEDEEDVATVSSTGEEDDDGLSKNDLVEGLVAAVCPLFNLLNTLVSGKPSVQQLMS